MVDFIKLAQPGISDLSPYEPGKPVEELERELGLTDIIKLASNENPLGPSPKVLQALASQLGKLARYPDGSAFLVKSKLQEFIGVAPDRLTIGNGSNDVLELLARIYLAPGKESIVGEHSFIVYQLVTKSLDATLITVPTKNYRQDLEAMLGAITPRTSLVFIANPNNPTGSWATTSELLFFLDRVPPHVIVVLDEAYFEYADAMNTREGIDYPNGLQLIDQYPNLVVTRTFSKAYGLAGLRIGYSVSNQDIADLMNRTRQPFNVNAMSLAAVRGAIDDQAHLHKSIALNHEGMQYLMASCEQLGFDYIPSAGNFLSINFGRDASPLYQRLLQEGVIVRTLGVYGLPCHLRVTTGLPAENERFVASLRKILQAGW